MASHLRILNILVGCVHTGNSVAFFMEPVAAFLILDKDDDHQADGHAESKSENIDNRKAFVLEQCSESDFKIISNHVDSPF